MGTAWNKTVERPGKERNLSKLCSSWTHSTKYVLLFARDIFMQYLPALEILLEEVVPMFKLFINQSERANERVNIFAFSFQTKRMNVSKTIFFYNASEMYALHVYFRKKKRLHKYIYMISNSKLKPSRQKNEYLFRYINKELGWEKVSIVRMRFFEKVSHFNMISRLPFFWLKWFRFGSVRFGSGSMLNSIAKSVRSLGVWVPHLFIFANYVTVLQRIFFFLLTLQIRKAGAVSRIFSHFFPFFICRLARIECQGGNQGILKYGRNDWKEKWVTEFNAKQNEKKKTRMWERERWKKNERNKCEK